jgi:membrane protease YdiL (CAAX protease family)
MLATGCMGALLGLLYLATRNLWPVIICHALVDTVSLLVVYSGHGSWLFP